uniref:VWFA domain-containing protein n=1 Tax=Panagrellus redivivus TaxID=6233 RepID=A0A7E4W5B6_PANRE
MNTAFETHGFDNIANQNELDRYLNSTYQDGNSTRGGQSALKDGFISVNYDDGYRPDINNHLIIYVTTNGTADAAAVSAAMSIISSGKYSIAAVAYDANALMLDVGGDVPKTLRDDLRIFLMNALSPFDIGWQNNFHVAIFNVFGDDMNTAFETHGFDNIANQNELDRYLNLTYQDGNSTRGGQSALKDGFISVNYDDGYRPDINNHLIIYVTTNGTADAAAVSAAMSIISSGKYSVAAVAYDANGSNTVSLTSLVGGKAECVITANDPDDLTITAAEKLTNLIWKASNNNGTYC